MTVGILGKKIGMTQLFQEDGKWIPVTVVQAGPCRVLQVKSKEVAELPDVPVGGCQHATVDVAPFPARHGVVRIVDGLPREIEK